MHIIRYTIKSMECSNMKVYLSNSYATTQKFYKNRRKLKRQN